MSFWSENKGAFKSAGIATVKGIGTGTKALSKAGYNTYKKHDAEKKGLPPPVDNGEKVGSPPPVMPATPAAPIMEKEKLLSLPAPPRRNVPTHEVPTRGGVSAYSNVQAQPKSSVASTASLQQSVQPSGQSMPIPPAPPRIQSPQAVQQHPVVQQPLQPASLPARDTTFELQQPNLEMAVQAPLPIPPRDYSQRAPAPMPAQQDTPIEPAVISPVSVQPFTGQHGEPVPVKVPKPAPDASMFAPPPTHKHRGATGTPISPHTQGRPLSTGAAPPTLPTRTGSSASSSQTAIGNLDLSELNSPPPSYTATANEPVPSSSHTGSSKSENNNHPVRAPVRYVDIDMTQFGPPPPRRVDAGPIKPVSKVTPSLPLSRGAVPPPPPRSVSASSTASIPPSSPSADEVGPKPKKAPPPKPAKLQQTTVSGTEASTGGENKRSEEAKLAKTIESFPSSSAPNFAAEIAKLRSQKTNVSSEETPASAKPEWPTNTSRKTSDTDQMTSPTLSPRPASSSEQPHKPIKPVKPVKPSKPTKPSGISLKGSPAPESIDSNHSMGLKPKAAPSKPAPKPLVLPFTVNRSSLVVPVKDQLQQSGLQDSSALKGENLDKPELISGDSSRKANSIDCGSSPFVIPLSSGSDVSKPSVPRVPGFRVPVKGQFHHPSKTSEASSASVPPPTPTRRQGPESFHKLSASSTPPPVPPSRLSRVNSNASSESSTPPPPPPTRNYIRAPARSPTTKSLHPDLDLELETGWYANTQGPLKLPTALAGLNYSTSFQTSSRSFPHGIVSGNSRSIDVRFKDLSRAIYKIRWLDDKFSDAVGDLIKFVPSPIERNSPTKKELLEYSDRFGKYVTSWCLRKEGQQVGSGECWDLAHEALAKGCGKHAFVSQYYHHGYPILELSGSSSGSSVSRGPEDEIRPGDILQFKSATLRDSAKGLTQTVGNPDHTAIVYDKKGDILNVLEQNVQGKRVVMKGEYALKNMVGGSVTVCRPVPAEWAE
ncbi:hypothetical protein OY671_003012 [Metschnikowia pulcherrima]|nr:hypothetical protein OY671_003012 [Metschnikowia pulcherrima]